MKRIICLVCLYLLTCGAKLQAQTFNVNINRPQHFAVQVPDGNYRVTLTLGSPERAAETVVRAENRRLMLERVTTKKREQRQISFCVNKRTPYINKGMNVKIKDRERDYKTWNDSLDLEFAASPAVTRIVIEPDTTAQTVYLCGNSTVTDQPYDPYCSWGQMLPCWFDDKVCISNHAESGLTARTFIASNRLEQVCSHLRAGDIVICEFGHNDEKEHRPGDGAWYHYIYNLKIFIDRVRQCGADIIFCTPTQRRFFEDDGKTIRSTHGEFPAAMRSIAERENVPCIDLTSMTTTFYQALGAEGSKKSLVHYSAGTFRGQSSTLADNTHFNPYGAYEVAKMVIEGMHNISIPSINNLLSHLRTEWTYFDVSKPDSPASFHWCWSDLSDTRKPDGN